MRRPPSPDPFVVSADEMPQSERTKGPPQPTLIASEPVSGTERRTDIDRFTITKAALISVAANNSSVVEGAGAPTKLAPCVRARFVLFLIGRVAKLNGTSLERIPFASRLT